MVSISEGPTQNRFAFALKAGDDLYRQGQNRNGVYRIEAGAFALINTIAGSPSNGVRLAFSVSYLGLGFLERHVETARAIVESVVHWMPYHEFVDIMDRHPSLKQQNADAIERDFAHRKAHLTRQRANSPMGRVAAFLVAAAHQNAREGQDPTLISDLITCDFVANILDLDISALANALTELRNLGLVEVAADRKLRLKSLAELERLSRG